MTSNSSKPAKKPTTKRQRKPLSTVELVDELRTNPNALLAIARALTDRPELLDVVLVMPGHRRRVQDDIEHIEKLGPPSKEALRFFALALHEKAGNAARKEILEFLQNPMLHGLRVGDLTDSKVKHLIYDKKDAPHGQGDPVKELSNWPHRKPPRKPNR